MLMRDFVRQLNREKFIDNWTSYVRVSSASSWYTAYSKTFTVDYDGQVLLWSFRWVLYTSSSAAPTVRIRVSVNNIVVYEVHGNFPADYSGTNRDKTETGMVKLSAGSYTFKIEVIATPSVYYLDIREVKLGLFYLSDQSGVNASNSVSVSAGSTVTVLSASLPIPARRRIPLGYTKKTLARIMASVKCEGYNIALRNPGESDVSGILNARLYVGGAEVGWTIRRYYSDYNANSSDTVWGLLQEYIKTLAETSGSLTIEVRVTNGYSSALTVSANLQAYSSVWLMPSSLTDMVDLDVPFGSTIYVVSEPLFANPTKVIYLGYQKAWSTVFNLDSYYQASGTDILQFNYTFDLYPSQLPSFLKWSGFGASVSMLVADIR